MSPEQAEGTPAGPESDVYSLALTVYECLSGANPVDGGDAGRDRAADRRAACRRCREARPDLPEGFTAALDDCLAADAELRPSAAELAETLAEPTSTCSTPATRCRCPRAPTRGRLRPARSRGSRSSLALGAALVVLAGPLGAAGPRARPRRPRPAAARDRPRAELAARRRSAPCSAISARRRLRGARCGRAATAREAPGSAPASWLWLAGIGLALGTGPDLGLGEPAPAGWAADPRTAFDAVLAPLLSGRSLLAAVDVRRRRRRARLGPRRPPPLGRPARGDAVGRRRSAPRSAAVGVDGAPGGAVAGGRDGATVARARVPPPAAAGRGRAPASADGPADAPAMPTAAPRPSL